MPDLLKKLKLEKSFVLELDVDAKTFRRYFKEIVDPSDLGLTSKFFEVLDFSKNKYKGRIGKRKFELRKRLRFFEFNKYKPIIEGVITENESGLVLQIEIGGLGWQVFFIPMGFIVFALIMSSQAVLGNAGSNLDFLLFMIPVVCISSFITFRRMRNSVRSLEESFRKDFGKL